MSWQQQAIEIDAKARGFHLITDDIALALQQFEPVAVGLLHVFIQHTSASLTLNENADPSVRTDFLSYFNRLAPEGAPYYTHTQEGPDDMPAHLKSSLLDSSLTLPVSNGRLNIGTWQGIYLCEHRNHAGPRRLILTLQGD